MLSSSFVSAQQVSTHKSHAPRAGVKIVSNAGQSELRVDGIPFFVHGAQFDYFRIPPDLWSQSLDRYRELGINTIDLRIPWNWHEPSDANFDFDGHTNLRRNLRGLLHLITEKQMKIVARPGPLIGDYWRNSGYPPWLLAFSTYKMNESNIAAGLPPPDADLASQDGNAAALNWLANEMHMSYARRWLTAVAKELAPYSARNTFEVREPGDREGETHIEEVGGPLLYVILDDSTAILPGPDAQALSRYFVELRRALEQGGLNAISFINVSDIAVPEAPELPNRPTVEGVGFTSQWSFKPSTERTLANDAGSGLVKARSPSPQQSVRLSTSDAVSLSSLASGLNAQSDFPPLLSGLSTTTVAPADDVRAVQPSSDNLLLASRILLGSGLRGITYSPLQDTLTPAGWGVPSAARYFQWDSALDLTGNRGPLANGVARNGKLISQWGAMLASSHPRPDFAVLQLTASRGSSIFDSDVIVSPLVWNGAATDSTGPVLQPMSCAGEQLCAAALVSVTNLSPDRTEVGSFEFKDPRPSMSKPGPPAISIAVTVPPHESLMLPVHAPLCSAASIEEHCMDEVISAGAELLGVERDGKTLELKFYAPARATVSLHLESQPTKVEIDDDIRLESGWKRETGTLELSLLRGAAPDYLRVLRIHLRYTPHVIEKLAPEKNRRGSIEHEVFNAVRLPLAPGASISTGPPLILTGPGAGGQIVITSWNRTSNQSMVDFSLDGAFRGSDSTRVLPDELQFTRIRFQPSRRSATAETPAADLQDGLLHGKLAIHSGHDNGNLPILFVPSLENGSIHYQNDFDRDGSPEWVLESSRLRLIVSPADGGRVQALVDKSTNENLIALGGALHDLFNPAVTGSELAISPADFSSNRAYRAAWVEEQKGTSLQLDYSAYEHSLAGLHVEKTLRLTAPETVDATYRVSIGAPGVAAPDGNLDRMPTFSSGLTVPASGLEDEKTQFCWLPASSISPSSATTAPAKSDSGMHCEDFVPLGESIAIPTEITRIEIRTANRRTLSVEWTLARPTIVPRTFSAQLRFAIPVSPAGAAPTEFTLRYTVGEPVP